MRSTARLADQTVTHGRAAWLAGRLADRTLTHGLVGPNGLALTGWLQVAIRGRGSVKEGRARPAHAMGRPDPSEDDELHVLITGETDDDVDRVRWLGGPRGRQRRRRRRRRCRAAPCSTHACGSAVAGSSWQQLGGLRAAAERVLRTRRLRALPHRRRGRGHTHTHPPRHPSVFWWFGTLTHPPACARPPAGRCAGRAAVPAHRRHAGRAPQDAAARASHAQRWVGWVGPRVAGGGGADAGAGAGAACWCCRG